jgi:hypothetical protein
MRLKLPPVEARAEWFRRHPIIGSMLLSLVIGLILVPFYFAPGVTLLNFAIVFGLAWVAGTVVGIVYFKRYEPPKVPEVAQSRSQGLRRGWVDVLNGSWLWTTFPDRWLVWSFWIGVVAAVGGLVEVLVGADRSVFLVIGAVVGAWVALTSSIERRHR